METFRVVHVYWKYAPTTGAVKSLTLKMYRAVYDTTEPLPLVESLSLKSDTVSVDVIPPEAVVGPRDRGGFLPIKR